MSGFWDNKQAVLEVIEKASHSIRVHLNGSPGIWFFQSVLKKAREGLTVEINCSNALFSDLGINEAYIENLRSAGGAWFIYDLPGVSPVHPSRIYACILADGASLIMETPQTARTGKPQTGSEPDLIDRVARHFQQMKEDSISIVGKSPNGHPPEPQSQIEIRFEARPRSVDPGEPFELVWSVSGASHVEIEPGVGPSAHAGTQIMTLDRTTEFALRAVNREMASVKVLAVEVDADPKIRYRLTTLDFATGGEIPLYFRADFPDHYGIIHGQAVTLYWEILNAESAEIDGIGPVEPNGFKVLTPEKLTAYTLIARGNGTLIKKVVVINVFPMPTMEKIRSVLPESMEIRSVLHFNNIPVPAWLTRPMELEIPESVIDPADGQDRPSLGPGKKEHHGPLAILMRWFKRKNA